MALIDFYSLVFYTNYSNISNSSMSRYIKDPPRQQLGYFVEGTRVERLW